MKQWQADTRENWFKILTLILSNLVLKSSFTLSSCLCFVIHVGQTNELKTVHTLQCTLYTVHYVPYRQELSKSETSQEKGHMWEMLLWLMSRFDFISTLGKLDSIFITFKDCYYGLSWWIHTLLLYKLLFRIIV